MTEHLDPHPADVYMRHEMPPALLRLAHCQEGVLSWQQIRGHNLSRNVVARLVQSGSWQRLTPGLYLTNPLPPAWPALAWGGVLLGGPRARLGPDASGHLHGLLPTAPDPVDVMVPVETVLLAREHWRFLRERPGARGSRTVGSPPRLSVEDTVLDLADARPAGDVVGLVTVAVGNRLTTPDRLRTRLDRRSRHAHRALLLGMLSEVADGAESPLEVLYVRTVERPHGLPRGDRQTSRTGLAYQRDVRYRRFALLVELDGRDGHTGVDRFRDMNRDNLHALLDEFTLRFGWFDVSGRACVVAYQVYLGLVRGGYNDPFLRCVNCRDVPELELAIA